MLLHLYLKQGMNNNTEYAKMSNIKDSHCRNFDHIVNRFGLRDTNAIFWKTFLYVSCLRYFCDLMDSGYIFTT